MTLQGTTQLTSSLYPVLLCIYVLYATMNKNQTSLVKMVVALAVVSSISAMVMPTTSYALVANPYCDKVSDEYMESGGACHDRRDYYDGGVNDGLFPCNDGSARTDWEDCPDVSGFNYSSSSDDDKDDDGRSDSEPRELEEGESVEMGEPVRGYTEDDGEIVDEDSLFGS
jgi:hypothetical protein